MQYILISYKNNVVVGLIFLLLHHPILSFAQKTEAKLFFDPQKKLTQYTINHWGTDDGLPSNNVNKLSMTDEGFLWLSSFNGLSKFDGKSFLVHNKKDIPELNNNSFYTLTYDNFGNLWVGTKGSGLYVYHNNAFEFVGLAGESIQGVFLENKNKLWVGVKNKGIYWYDPIDKKLTKVEEKLVNNSSVYIIRQRHNGEIWISTQKNGLVIYKNNTWKKYTLTNEDSKPVILDIFFDAQNNIWLGTTKGLYKKVANQFKKIEPLEDLIIRKIIQDAYGSLWLATSSGLYRKNSFTGDYERYPTSPYAPFINVIDLLLDKEGSLWISTYRNGLYRLKDAKFTNITHQEGLVTASVGAICEYGNNTFLIGSNDGRINLLIGNEVLPFPLKTKLPRLRVFNIMKDSKRNIWISTFEGLIKLTPKKEEIVYRKNKGLDIKAARLTYEDSQGNIWVGGEWSGVNCLKKNGDVVKYNTKNGLSSNFIMSINEDQKGNILVGTNDAGLNIIQKSGKINVYNIKSGLTSNLVFNTYTDQENTIWVVSNAGISRIKNNKVFSFTIKDKLPNESIYDFLEDDNGNIWLPNSKGILQVSKEALNNYADGLINKLDWRLFNKSDGMKNEDCTGASHSLKAKNGKILIPTNGGIVIIDPDKIPANDIVPNVLVNKVWVDGTTIDIKKDNIVISANAQRLIFDYSALSMLSPEKVRFKYKIEGFDKEWIDAGNERQAVYTSLPYGHYVFHVIASNNDGIWNKKGARIKFEIKPKFYETIWFWFIILVVLGWLVFGLIKWMTFYNNKKKSILHAQIEKRTQQIREKNLALEKQKTETEKQKNLLEKRNYEITSSFNYAKTIQEAILPTAQQINQYLPDSFIYFKPKETISGDFYWFGHKNYKSIIATIDCKGMGLSGAFLSMIIHELLNEIVLVTGTTAADKILNALHIGLSRTFRHKETAEKEAIDVGIVAIDQIPVQHVAFLPAQKLQFAGANSFLFYVKKGQVIEIEGDDIAIGGSSQIDEDLKHKKHEITLNDDISFYMLTDGYINQLGGEPIRKYGKQRLMQQLLEIHNQSMSEQERQIIQNLHQWKGELPFADDILLLGFKA